MFVDFGDTAFFRYTDPMQKPELAEKIGSLVAELHEIGKQSLAMDIEKHASKTVLEYSQELWQYRSDVEIEPALIAGLTKEFERIGIRSENATRAIESFRTYRTIQTAPHLGLTESARMLTVNWLSSRGLPDDAYYLVGMFSGVPFSNLTRPGAINWGVRSRNNVTDELQESGESDNRLSLFPSTMQDALVYQSTIPQKFCERYSKLTSPLRDVLEIPIEGESYTRYATRNCATIEKTILNVSHAVYFDINEVIKTYLETVLADENHLI